MMFQLKRTRKKTPFLIIFAERRKRHVKSHNFSQSLSLTYLLIYATIPSREITFFFPEKSGKTYMPKGPLWPYKYYNDVQIRQHTHS